MTNFRFQILVLFFGILIAVIKFVLYFNTHSNAIFSDAMESIVNITANSITLYSLYLAAKPKDKRHPYGHGKVEFIAAGIEGTLLFIAGLFIIYKSILELIFPKIIDLSGYAFYVLIILGLANYLLGYLSLKKGEQTNSAALIAGGKHLKGDGYTTFAILFSIIIVYLTQFIWIDAIAAIIAGLLIVYQAWSVIKQSLRNILDATDEKIIFEIIDLLQRNKSKYWIDIHNLRMIKYGADYHIDAHLTLPYYFNNIEIHQEVKSLDELINNNFKNTVEFFIHSDPCEPSCCHYCQLDKCQHRKELFHKEIIWTPDNVLKNNKHFVH